MEGASGSDPPPNEAQLVNPAICSLVRILRFEVDALPELLQLAKVPATGKATIAYKRTDFIRLVLVILKIKIVELLLDGGF